jgi:hypothetical protein
MERCAPAGPHRAPPASRARRPLAPSRLSAGLGRSVRSERDRSLMRRCAAAGYCSGSPRFNRRKTRAFSAWIARCSRSVRHPSHMTPTTSPSSPGISSQYSAAGESKCGAGRWQRRQADVGPLGRSGRSRPTRGLSHNRSGNGSPGRAVRAGQRAVRLTWRDDGGVPTVRRCPTCGEWSPPAKLGGGDPGRS